MSELSVKNEICRLCLGVSNNITNSLTEDHEIVKKIWNCFCIKINKENYFPNAVCEICTKKVNEMHEFQFNVREADRLLHQKIRKGIDELNRFCLSLKGITIKEEFDNNAEYEEDKLNKPNMNTKIDIKVEVDNITESDNLDISSEDDLDLPLIKKEDYKVNAVVETDHLEMNILSQNNTFIISALQFKCLTCFTLFETKNELLSHYNKDHSNKPENVDKSFEVITRDGNVAYKCNLCFKEFTSKKAIVRHIGITHSQARPYICKMCGRTFKTVSEIVRHNRAHYGKTMFCRHKCGYSTVYSGALKDHEKRHNKADFKYKCEKCGIDFQVKTWYEQHQNVHSGLKPYVCDICGVAFHMERYLTAHRSSVHPQSSSLKRYVCVHCSLPCDSRFSLTEHLKEHGIKSNTLCDLCGKVLSNAKQLALHKKMHLNDKQFSCSLCKKSFAKKYNLQVHLQSHSEAKSHACSKCGKQYSQKSTLLRHNRRHHSEESHKCLKCSKQFVSQHRLILHQKICI